MSKQPDNEQNGLQHSATAASTLEDAMDRIMGVASVASSSVTEGVSFIASPTWSGSKVGYFFGTDSQGTGYYRDENRINDNNHLKKHSRNDEDVVNAVVPLSATGRLEGEPHHRLTGEELLQQAEQQQQQQQLNHVAVVKSSKSSSQPPLLYLEFTAKGLQQATVTLSKWHTHNALQRAEHTDDPRLYMDSEVQLQQAIVVWKGLAAQPKWFAMMLSQQEEQEQKSSVKSSTATPVLSTLQQLLVHENADIAVSVTLVFGEWLDPQVIEDVDDDDDEDDGENGSAQDEVASLVFRLAYWLVVQSGGDSSNVNNSSGSGTINQDPSAWDCIVSNLGRLSIEDDEDNNVGDDDNEDFQGVQTILNLTDQLLDLDVLRFAAAAASETAIPIEDAVASIPSTQKIPPSWVPFMMKKSVASSSCSLLLWLMGVLQDAIASDKTDGDKYPIVGRVLEVLSTVAQREEVYAVHPDWTRLPKFRSMFDDDDDDAKLAEKQTTKRQKKDPNNSSEASTKEDDLLNAIETMLQLMAPFRKRNPTTDAELDWLENTCLTLASTLTFSPVRHLPYFLEAQGIELILRCLKEQVHAGGVGLKLLDFNLTISTSSTVAQAQELDSQAKRACEHLVKSGGFKFLFPLLMGKSLPHRALVGPTQSISTASTSTKRQDREWNQMMQDQTIRILYSLSRYLTDSSPEEAKARFLAKFVEGNCEKCDRLVDLVLRYDQKTRQAEYRFYRNTDVDELDHDDELENDTAALQAKLQGGGDLFYCLCSICAFCCVGSKRCHERIVEQLSTRQSGLSLIQTGLQEHINVLDDGTQQDQVRFYLKALF